MKKFYTPLFSVFFIVIFSSVSFSVVKTKNITIKGFKFLVEIADDFQKREQGLSGRIIKPDEGMLFVLDEVSRPYFWMNGCLEPLDIIWIDEKGVVAGIVNKAPLMKKNKIVLYFPDQPIKYVLELKGGTSKRIGIKKYDKIIF